MKYSIRKYTINFFKKLAKNANKKIADWERKLKHYGYYVDNIDYKVCKQQLDAIYEEKAEGMEIRSKCNWYEHGEKSTKFFLIWKNNAIQSQIHSVINQVEITDQDKINKQIFSFNQSLLFA